MGENKKGNDLYEGAIEIQKKDLDLNMLILRQHTLILVWFIIKWASTKKQDL